MSQKRKAIGCELRTSLAALALMLAQGASAEARQRVVISDNYTSWLLKSQQQERYGDGEALPRFLAEGWTIATVTPGCSQDGHTVYVLNAPVPRSAPATKR